MPIVLDHVFVCCDPGAPQAQGLLDLGLTEGTPNTHPGQGTANRRFFFHGGYLELLWVSDPEEARSEQAARTRLWERWSGRRGDTCPFGVAFAPSGTDVPAAPFAAWSYRPAYLPAGAKILMAEGTPLAEPELFYLAWPRVLGIDTGQQRTHRAPLVKLQSVSVGLQSTGVLSDAARAAVSAGLLKVHTSVKHELVVEFRAVTPVTYDLRESLGLVLRGVA